MLRGMMIALIALLAGTGLSNTALAADRYSRYDNGYNYNQGYSNGDYSRNSGQYYGHGYARPQERYETDRYYGYRDDYRRHNTGRAVATIGGGAAAGAVIGGLSGGGKGAAIGAGIGALGGLIINQAMQHHHRSY